MADIEKAFLQVGLQPKDRDSVRFLWLKDATVPKIEDNIQEYRFCRIPFGVISSPFLLSATINYHLKQQESPVASQLLRDIYVDNFLTSTDSTAQGVQIYEESKKLLNDIKMNLREWKSNDKQLMQNIPSYDQATENHVKVFGLDWNIESDKLYIKGTDIKKITTARTKREILQAIASIYDPMGFFSPVTLPAKLYLQQLWAEGKDWDDVLDTKEQEEWLKVAQNLEHITLTPTDRYIGPKENDDVKYQLLCFCDASIKSYAAVIYLRWKSGDKCGVHLIFSKNRLAPQKKLTIPRLELMAVLIGARCIEFVKKELHLSIQKEILWSDSQCTLGWIKGKKVQPVFVENRIKEIRTYKNLNFRYINSKQNPADIASRGNSMENLMKDTMWLNGPEWLIKSEKTWPTWNVPEITEDQLDTPEITNLLAQEDLERKTDEPLMNVKRFSSLMRLLRTTAWVLRFIAHTKKLHQTKGPLTTTEIKSARHLWDLKIQNENFPEIFQAIHLRKKNQLKDQLGIIRNDQGLLRCQGRLTNSYLTSAAKTPKLLPKGN